MNPNIEQFNLTETAPFVATLHELNEKMCTHRVFGMVKDKEDLKLFMQTHAYAVWDFMLLLKRIQSEYTGYRFPWTPPRIPENARLINEIVLSEETEEIAPGVFGSHFELYRAAMEEVGADCEKIDAFLMNLRFGVPPEAAIATVFTNEDDPVRAAIMDYVAATTTAATRGTTEQVLAYFVFGREDPIPAMFSALRDNMGELKQQAPNFVKYLELHIQLDGEHHGKASVKMLANEVGGNPTRTINALKAGIAATQARIALWDSIAAQIEKRRGA